MSRSNDDGDDDDAFSIGEDPKKQADFTLEFARRELEQATLSAENVHHESQVDVNGDEHRRSAQSESVSTLQMEPRTSESIESQSRDTTPEPSESQSHPPSSPRDAHSSRLDTESLSGADIDHHAQQSEDAHVQEIIIPPLPPSEQTVQPPTPIMKSPISPNAERRLSAKHTNRPSGPSALQKVLSRTRPTHLPPKNKIEDQKHLADWEKMMQTSRQVAEKKRTELQERRLARELDIENSIGIWEREIIPNLKSVRKDSRLRKLWWKGIPPKLRSAVWSQSIGNGLALSKSTYKSCLTRAQRAIAKGTFPQEALEAIDADVETTLPGLHIFRRDTGPMHDDLRRFLQAWTVSRSDEQLGYASGAAKLAAMFLLNMEPPQAFISMRNLIDRHCLRSFYGGPSAKEDVEAYYRIFDTLLADGMAKVYFNFKQHHISPSAYVPDWVMPLFLDHLPFDACARIWDVLILEGDSFLYKASLAILGVLEPRLFFPDREELLQLLKGHNPAALEVALREGLSLDNAAKYEIYGINEETLWERLEEMDEWWRETTWGRLIARELPDV